MSIWVLGNSYAFGSYGRRQVTPQSDLDIRIEKGAIRSLLELADFRLTLEEALSIPVDVVTEDISDKRFLESIAADEVLLYDEAEDSVAAYSGKTNTEQEIGDYRSGLDRSERSGV